MARLTALLLLVLCPWGLAQSNDWPRLSFTLGLPQFDYQEPSLQIGNLINNLAPNLDANLKGLAQGALNALSHRIGLDPNRPLSVTEFLQYACSQSNRQPELSFTCPLGRVYARGVNLIKEYGSRSDRVVNNLVNDIKDQFLDRMVEAIASGGAGIKIPGWDSSGLNAYIEGLDRWLAGKPDELEQTIARESSRAWGQTLERVFGPNQPRAPAGSTVRVAQELAARSTTLAKAQLEALRADAGNEARRKKLEGISAGTTSARASAAASDSSGTITQDALEDEQATSDRVDASVSTFATAQEAAKLTARTMRRIVASSENLQGLMRNNLEQEVRTTEALNLMAGKMLDDEVNHQAMVNAEAQRLAEDLVTLSTQTAEQITAALERLEKRQRFERLDESHLP